MSSHPPKGYHANKIFSEPVKREDLGEFGAKVEPVGILIYSALEKGTQDYADIADWYVYQLLRKPSPFLIDIPPY